MCQKLPLLFRSEKYYLSSLVLSRVRISIELGESNLGKANVNSKDKMVEWVRMFMIWGYFEIFLSSKTKLIVVLLISFKAIGHNPAKTHVNLDIQSIYQLEEMAEFLNWEFSDTARHAWEEAHSQIIAIFPPNVPKELLKWCLW